MGFGSGGQSNYLSYDISSGRDITPCNEIYTPLVVYRFSGNFMTSITMLYIMTK